VPLIGTVTPPGSKSITNRLLVLAALASGESRLRGPLRSEDTDGLLTALNTLGVTSSWDGEDLIIRGVAGHFPRGGAVNCGDGGTPTRLMIAAAALAAEPVIIDGSARMRERPVADGVTLLRAIGGAADFADGGDRLPVRVLPQRPHGGSLNVWTTSSSQFVTAVMLIAPWLTEGLTLRFDGPVTSASYLDLTRAALADFGVDVSVDDDGVLTIWATTVTGRDVTVESDASGAVYWMIAAAMVPGSRVTVSGLSVDSAQPDIAIVEVLRRMGLDVTSSASPRSITVASTQAVRAIEVDLGHMPDGAMAVAALCAVADGPSRLTGLATLRVKETDRVAALETELRRVGCVTRAGPDWLEIEPMRTGSTEQVVVETYRDHRMAMAFAILGLRRGHLAIADPSCVGKSYPGFWDDLVALCGTVK